MPSLLPFSAIIWIGRHISDENKQPANFPKKIRRLLLCATKQEGNLKLLAEDEVEVAAANILAGGSVFVKAIGPVDTHQTDKVEEQADTHTGRLAKGEGVHLAHIRPSISGFYKAEGIDVGGGFKHEGIAEFETETRVGIGVSGVVAGDGAVFITAQGDGLLSVGGVAGHTVTTDVEGFEGRFAVFVVGANDTEVGARHDDRTVLQTRIEGGVGA